MKPILATLIGVLLVAAPLTAQQEEKPKVPKNSVLVDVTGCLKGRVLRAEDVRQPDTTTGLVIRNRAFRLAGKKDVMNAVKEADGQRVTVQGLIKKNDVSEPGLKFKGGRIRIGGGTNGGSVSSLPDPADNVVVLDLSSVQAIGGTCGR